MHPGSGSGHEHGVADAHEHGVTATAHRFGQYRWAALQLFEVLGTWATNHPTPHTSALLATHSHQHGRHAAAFAARVPCVGGLDAATVTAPWPELVALLDLARSAPDTATLMNTVYGEVLPTLAAAYEHHLAAIDPRVDGPTAHVLAVVLRDLSDQRVAAAALPPD